jgi:hypothetical protein
MDQWYPHSTIPMQTFEVVAGIASLLGLLCSFLAFLKAKSASEVASQVRDSVGRSTLADELEIACLKAEQLVDFLAHRRLGEAALRVDELTSTLSEVRTRRTQYLSEAQVSSVLTAREQLNSIADVILATPKRSDEKHDGEQFIRVARRAMMSLREILGRVKSDIELRATDEKPR